MTMPPRFRPLPPGDAVTRWAMADRVSEVFPGTARPMPDRVDYRFVNGWVDTGDLPCREALLAIRGVNDTRPVTCPDPAFPAIHLSGDSPDADFSQFCHRPTLVRHTLRCLLRGAGAARFRLSTCGGVRVWSDRALAASFQPFTRNRPQTREITLPLTPQGREITVELEDLHERDTTCFVSLVLLDGVDVAAALPGNAPDATTLDDAMAAMDALRTDRIFHESGPINLLCDAPPATALPIRVTDIGPFLRGGIAGDAGRLPDVRAALLPEGAPVTICEAAQAPQGAIHLTVTAQVGGARISRTLGTTVLSRATQLDQPTPAARKAAALTAICAEAAFDPAVALALLASGAASSRAEAILEHTLTTVEQRHDCCDFSLLSLLRILRDYSDELPAPLRHRLRRAALEFRYWLDGPGNDVMWFWSENHVACFHICQLIAGSMMPDETFANSGRSGADLAGEATTRLHRWFDAIDAHGLGEWNSAAYYPIDLLALFTLHDLSPDRDLRDSAAALIDRIFVMTGLHCTGGVPAGSQGRAYEKELLAGPATELGSVAAIAFGGAYPPAFDRAAVPFCLSDYEPPALAARLAHPAPGQRIVARYTQGTDHLGRLSLWKSRDVQLSTVSEHKSGQPGHQQHVIDVQCAAHPMARLWINHPGELKEWGDRRPSLLAGNGVLPRLAQHGPAALMIYDLPGDAAIPFTQLFAAPDAFDAIRHHDGWTLLHSGAARVAVWCASPLQTVTRGLYRGSLHRAHARRCGWIVLVGDAALERDLQAVRPTFHADGVVLSARVAGARLALPFDGPLTVDGIATPFAPLTSVPQIALDGGPLRDWRDLA